MFAAAVWRADRRRFVLLAVGVLFAGVLPAALMLASGRVIDALVSVENSARDALVATGWFVAASLGLAGTRWVCGFVEARLSGSFLGWAEDELAGAVLGPQTIGHLEDPSVTAQISVAAEAMDENTYYWALKGFVRSSTVRLTGLVSAGMLFAFVWWAPVLLLVGYGLMLLAYVRWEQANAERLTVVMGTSRRRAEYYRELLAEPAAAKEVRIFAMAGWLDRRFGSVWLTAMDEVWHRRGAVQWWLAAGASTLVATHVVVVWALVDGALAGRVTAAAVTVFVQAIVGMDGLVSAQYDSLGVVKAASALANLRRLQARLPGDASPTPPQMADKAPCSVILRGVSFRYEGSEKPTLDRLDLMIEPGQSVGIVGANGAGKSTLIKLVAGLYRPEAGAVLIAGRPADATSGRVAAIFQSFGRYELRLRDNVTLTRPSVSDEAVHSALQLAGADRLGVGLDVPLSAAYDGGTDLSGGQWQRVALARALAAVDRGAGLLILDEPTASLDVRAEVELFDRLLEVTRGVTTILVSHRLSSVRHADRIVLLDGGRIAEDGSHDELMAAGGSYAAMFSLQASRFEVTSDVD